MTNVVELKTRTKVANQDTVDLLGRWLEKAKNGEIISASIVGVTEDLGTTSQWSQLEHVQVMLGGIEILKHRILRDVVEY